MEKGKNKYNMLFDATVLANELYNSGARTGIFFVAKNLFDKFLEYDNLNIFAYCSPKRLHDLEKVFSQNDSYKNIKIISFRADKFFYMIKETLSTKKETFSKEEHPFKRAYTNLLLLIVSIFQRFFYFINIIPRHLYYFYMINFAAKINLYFSPMYLSPKFIKENKKIQSAVYLHDTIPLEHPEFFDKAKGKKHWIFYLIKNFDKDELYFANSDCTKNNFLKHAPQMASNQITVAYLGADAKFSQIQDTQKAQEIKEKYNIPQNQKYIFSLCTLEPRKNLIFAVKNFIEFIKRYNIDDLNFVLGGSHWDNFIDQLSNQIENLGDYKNRIIKAGYVDDKDLPILYSNAFCLTYPSLYEGFGMPILEAMQCGCPVITSNVTSMPEVIGDAGIKINPKNDEEFIEALKSIYYDENLRQEYIAQGLERAKLFSWDKCAQIIIDAMTK